jgi:BA14K-like protein
MQKDAEILRLRTLAAAALLFAGLTLGFVLGRMSASLMPVAPGQDTPARVASDRKATEPSPNTASPARAVPAPGPAETPSSTASAQPAAVAPTPGPSAVASPAPSSSSAAVEATATPAAVGVGSQEPPKPVVAPNWRAAAGDPPGSASVNDEETNRAPPIKLINPSQAAPSATVAEPARNPEVDPSESEADRESLANRESLATCERRYSSFRRSDGTYQPFGGGPRQRCPMLR